MELIEITGEAAENGVYFVSASGSPVKVDPTDIVVNNPSEIIAVIPALPAGTYQVRIVTQYTPNKLLKTPHVFTFTKTLTVA